MGRPATLFGDRLEGWRAGASRLVSKILANPEVEVQVGTAKMRARAGTAVGEERARFWEQAVKFFPPYADDKVKAAGRDIPVVG